MNRRLTRRELIKYGALGLGTLTLGGSGLYSLLSQGVRSARADDDEFRTPIQFTPFTRALPVPETQTPVSPFTQQRCTLPPVSGLSTPKFYTVEMKTAAVEIIPGHPETVIWGYDGM